MVEFINKLICFTVSIGIYYIEKKEKVAEQLSAFKITMELYTMFFYHCIFIPFGPIILSFCMNWLWLHIPGIIDDIIARHTVHAESKVIPALARAVNMYAKTNEITQDNIINIAKFPHFTKETTTNYYNCLRLSSQYKMFNLEKELNPQQLNHSYFQKMRDVHCHYLVPTIKAGMDVNNIISANIYTQYELNCPYFIKKSPGIGNTDFVIKNGLLINPHPYFSITVDNGTNVYRQFCLLTHTPPYGGNEYATALGVNNYIPKRKGVQAVSHALCTWLVLEDEAFIYEDVDVNSNAYKCAIEYYKQLFEHTGMSMNNIITMVKYAMVYRDKIDIIEYKSDNFVDFCKLEEENKQWFALLNTKTKQEIDGLKEINLLNLKKLN